MTSVLLELKVKNRTSESVSRGAVGHWPSSPNYRGSVKSSQPLAIRRPAAGRKSCWVTGRRRRLIEPENYLVERVWAAVVWMCVSLDFYIMSLSSACCHLPAPPHLSSLKGVLWRQRIDCLKVDFAVHEAGTPHGFITVFTQWLFSTI